MTCTDSGFQEEATFGRTEMFDAVALFLGSRSKAIIWFDTPNPLLGNVSPNTMIDMGRMDKVAQFIRESLA